MDYEKKYKEALEDMRVIYPNLKGDAKLAVEHAFPELAESEDERIRKVIHKLLLGMREEIFTAQDEIVTKDKVLSWLEKQKEQKPVEIHIDNPNIQKIDPDVKISTSDSSASREGLIYASWRDEKTEQKPNIELIQRSWYMEGYNDRDFNKEPKWIIKTGEGGPRYEENPKYGQHIEKQDYSGLTELERAIHRGFLCAGVVNVPVNIIKETAQDCLAHLPVEWSEDFDKEVENIHKRYPEVSFAKLTRIAYHFSKWANRCKDIEWSEEDEK